MCQIVLKVSEPASGGGYYGGGIWANPPGVSFPYPPEFIFDLGLPTFIPVGPGGVPFLESWLGVLAQDATTSTLPAQLIEDEGVKDLPPAIDRRDVTPVETDLPVAIGGEIGWFPRSMPGILQTTKSEDQLWFERMFPGEVYNAPGSVPLAQAPQSTTILATQDAQIVSGGEVSWIEDIYTTVDASLGGILPGGAPLTSGGFPTSVVNPASVPVVTTPTVSPIPGTPAAVVNPAVKQYCYKLVDGQWKLVKMRRRRRKQLATKGDLQDLAALKGILGLGKAFEVWIATHS